MEGDQCTVSDLTDTFRPIHIPVNATFLGEFYLGTSADPKEGVLVEEWVGNVTDPRGMSVPGRTTKYYHFIFTL